MSLVSQIASLVAAIGADIKSLNTNKVSVVAGKGLSPITKVYDSGELTITAGALTTLTHSLGVTPKICTFTLICKTGELGYSAGDEATIHGGVQTALSGGYHFGVQLSCTSTQIAVRIGSSGIGLLAMSTGNAAAITPANWRLVIRAYA